MLKINPISLHKLTAWKTRQHMIDFRNSGSHLDSMKRSKHFGNIRSYTWEASALPNWNEAKKILNTHSN